MPNSNVLNPKPHPDPGADYWLKKSRETSRVDFDIFCRFTPSQMSIRFALATTSQSGERIMDVDHQIEYFLEELQGNHPPHEFHVDLRLYYKKMLRLGFSKCIPPEESSIFFLNQPPVTLGCHAWPIAREMELQAIFTVP